MTTTLQTRQAAGTRVEEKMLAFLLQFIPAENLTVNNVKCIAFEARRIAFDEFSKTVAQEPNS
jgi:hypothetical protein